MKPSVTIHSESLPEVRLDKNSTAEFGKSKNPMNRMRPGRAPQLIVINANDVEQSIRAQTNWLSQHYPGHKILHGKRSRHNGRIYIDVTLRTANGEIRTVRFDVTRPFYQSEGTQILVGTQGTIFGRSVPTTQLLR